MVHDTLHSGHFQPKRPDVDMGKTYEPLSAPLLPLVMSSARNVLVVSCVVCRLSCVALVHPSDQGSVLTLGEQIVDADNSVSPLLRGFLGRQEVQAAEMNVTCSALIAVVIVTVKLRENTRFVEQVFTGGHGNDVQRVSSRLDVELVEAFVADSTCIMACVLRSNVAVGVVDEIGNVVGHCWEDKVIGDIHGGEFRVHCY
jgi:hypothetical protein